MWDIFGFGLSPGSVQESVQEKYTSMSTVQYYIGMYTVQEHTSMYTVQEYTGMYTVRLDSCGTRLTVELVGAVIFPCYLLKEQLNIRSP